MSVMIRMSRQGSKGNPFYRIVVADKSFARDGRFIEKLGTYDPNNKNGLVLDKERVDYWLSVGARPTQTVASLIKRK
ncbi:MAG: 30S ribosomal protein S16 [Proteobacteria bacterium]|nr:30S ribosomal protein S16 [Pseudomonadota bacterium]